MILPQNPLRIKFRITNITHGVGRILYSYLVSASFGHRITNKGELQFDWDDWGGIIGRDWWAIKESGDEHPTLYITEILYASRR